MTSWILFITFLGYAGTFPRVAIDGFNNQKACEQAYIDIKKQNDWSDIKHSWSQNILDHSCVSIKKD